MLPVLLAKLFSLDGLHALRLLVAGIALASICWSLLILYRARTYGSGTLALISCALLLIELPEWNPFFGQREHLLLLLTFPYIIATSTEVVRRFSKLERFSLGFCALLGICFKPQQVLILIGLHAFLLLYTRSSRFLLSVEIAGMIAAGVLYLTSVYLLAPLYFKLIPLLRDTYWAYGTYTAGALVLRQKIPMLVLVFVAAGALWWRGRLRSSTVILAFLACALSASIVFDLQHTGFGYQQYPSLAWIAFASILLVIDLSEPLLLRLTDFHNHRWNVAVALSCFFLLIAIGATEWLYYRQRTYAPAYSGHVFDGIKAGESVSVFSTTLPVFTAVYERNLEWGSRFGQLGLLPAIVRSEMGRPSDGSRPFYQLTPATVAKLTDIQRRDTAEDLEYWRPTRVLVQVCPCPYLDDPTFDILGWFLKGSEFRSAWSHYQRRPGIAGFDVYDRVE